MSACFFIRDWNLSPIGPIARNTFLTGKYYNAFICVLYNLYGVGYNAPIFIKTSVTFTNNVNSSCYCFRFTSEDHTILRLCLCEESPQVTGKSQVTFPCDIV